MTSMDDWHGWLSQLKTPYEVPYVPTSYYPLPHFQSRDNNRRDIFGVLDPPSRLGKFAKLLNLPRYDFQRNYFQSFSLYFIKTSKNGLLVAKNVKIDKIDRV